MTDHKIIYQYGFKWINGQLLVNQQRWNPDNIYLTTLINTCSERHPYMKVKRTDLWILTLPTQHIVTSKLKNSLTNLTNVFTNTVKYKSRSSQTLKIKSIWDWLWNIPIENLKSIKSHTHPHTVPKKNTHTPKKKK